MSEKINLEEIILKHLKYDDSLDGFKEAMLNFGKQLLELAAENAKTREMTELWSGQVWDDGPLPICIDKQSILDTINQVK